MGNVQNGRPCARRREWRPCWCARVDDTFGDKKTHCSCAFD